MASPRAIRTGNTTAGVLVEYVRTRRVLRLGGWHSGGRQIQPVEVPTSAFLTRLGIGPDELGAVPAYVLQASVQDRRGGGLRHVIAAFPAELEARQAFRALRAEHSRPEEWAQVLTLDARCHLERLCWFGEPGQIGLDGRDPGVTPARARRWGPRRVRGSAGR